jgi:hypothetical protein
MPRTGPWPASPKSVLCLAFGLAVAAVPATAQTAAAPVAVTAARVDEKIVVDAQLDERVWRETTPIELPYETRPATNTPANVRTEAWIAYDDRALYFAFRAHDPNPELIRARFADRDTAFDDDLVGVILDPFHDGRRAFEFFVNPLGIQVDVLENDLVGGDDPSWDALWSAAGRITADGYVVEAAIPLSSLRYPRTEGEQVWGFNALRFHPRDSTRRLALHPLDRGKNCNLCQIGELRGIRGLEPRLDLEFDPTLTASRTDRRESFPDSPIETGDTDAEAGLTFRWGVTPNMTLNATLNPDFSQVEADAQQLDVNTQFALFYPEKRPFFLEGADLFDTVLDVVYTRNFADPDWGLKLTGKEGANAVGVLAARDAVINLLLPGAEGSELASIDDDSQSAILRYRRDLPLPGSTAGFVYAGREGGDYRNHLFGGDTLVRFGERHGIRLEAFASTTRYPEALAEEFGQPRGDFEGHGVRVGYAYTSDDWYGYGSYLDLGADFRADLGFVPQVDIRRAVLGLERIYRTDGDDWFNEMRFGGDYDETLDQSGELLEREYEIWWDYQGPRESAFHLRSAYRERAFQGVRFDETSFYLFGQIRPSATYFLTFEGLVGDDIDFANVRPGEVLRLDPGVRFDLGRHVRLALNYSYERLNVDGGELFHASLPRLTLVYQIDRRTQIRLVSQYLDVRRDPALYLDAVEPRTEQLANQLLFSWKLNPQTVFFAGYSDAWLGEQSVDLTRDSQTFFFKIGYAWLP